MSPTVAVPLWIAVLAGLLAAWAVLDRLLVPGIRWLVRRRTERLLERLETRFRIRVEPFKRTKREAPVERLIWDPQVQAAAEAEALSGGVPRDVVFARVKTYAREIVPAFNAYAYFRVGYPSRGLSPGRSSGSGSAGRTTAPSPPFPPTRPSSSS